MCSFVGKQVGAANYICARKHNLKVFKVGMCFGLAQFTVLAAGRENLIRIFTDDEAVLKAASQYYILVPFIILNDFTQTMTQGTIKALGFQRVASILNVFTYLGVGLPLSYLLGLGLCRPYIGETFKGSFGLMLGILIGTFMNCSGFLYIVFGPGSTKRWNKAIKIALEKQKQQYDLQDSFKNNYDDYQNVSI